MVLEEIDAISGCGCRLYPRDPGRSEKIDSSGSTRDGIYRSNDGRNTRSGIAASAAVGRGSCTKRSFYKWKPDQAIFWTRAASRIRNSRVYRKQRLPSYPAAWKEKSVIGPKREGAILQREVMQTSVSFEDHQLHFPSQDLSRLHRKIRHQMLAALVFPRLPEHQRNAILDGRSWKSKTSCWNF